MNLRSRATFFMERNVWDVMSFYSAVNFKVNHDFLAHYDAGKNMFEKKPCYI